MSDLDCLDEGRGRVGQKRAKEEVEVESKSKEDTSSAHGAVSTQTSSSEESRGFFARLGRATSTAPSKAAKSVPTTPFSTEKRDTSKRSALRILRRSAASAESPQSRASFGSEKKSPTSLPPVAAEDGAHGMGVSPRKSTDRSSKESALSKTTELTMPMLRLRSPGDDSTAVTKLVQALETLHLPKTAQRIPRHGKSKTSTPTSSQSRAGPQAKAAPTTPTPPTPSASQPPPAQKSPDDEDKPASEFIDDWYTALHAPGRYVTQPGPDGTTRRGNVLVPPNLDRPPGTLVETPTRQPRTKRVAVPIPTTPSPAKSLPDDPESWKAPADWECTTRSAESPGSPSRKSSAQDGVKSLS